MLKDVEYVKSVLAGDYETERPHEIPYPSLEQVIRDSSFDYLAGTVEGEGPNGEESREGHPYLWFQHAGKSILSHRFITAVTLGKWAPREFHVDHVNHNPSDNCPGNLRVVTPKDNAGNRRQALLSELADLEAICLELEERRRVEKLLKQVAPEPQPMPESEPKPNPDGDPHSSYFEPMPKVVFTGRTKPAEHSNGTWHETNLGSWHLRFD